MQDAVAALAMRVVVMYTQVRFQWWRDGLSAAYAGDPPKHPALVALAGVLHDSSSQQPSTSSSTSSQLQQDSSTGVCPKKQGLCMLELFMEGMGKHVEGLAMPACDNGPD